jgi:hypothetical protein
VRVNCGGDIDKRDAAGFRSGGEARGEVKDPLSLPFVVEGHRTDHDEHREAQRGGPVDHGLKVRNGALCWDPDLAVLEGRVVGSERKDHARLRLGVQP